VLADELEQGFGGYLFIDPLVMFFPGTVPTMMTMGRSISCHTLKDYMV